MILHHPIIVKSYPSSYDSARAIFVPPLVMFAAHKPDEDYLVGGFNQHLSKRLEFVNLDDESPNWM